MSGLVEISAAGVTTASALVDLCNRLGVDAADLVAPPCAEDGVARVVQTLLGSMGQVTHAP